MYVCMFYSVGTAVEQIVSIANKALAFREHQKQLLHSNQPDDAAIGMISSAVSVSGTNNKSSSSTNTDDNNDKHLHANCSHSVAAKRFKSSSSNNNNNNKNKKIGLGDVTSLNLTALHAGTYACMYVVL